MISDATLPLLSDLPDPKVVPIISLWQPWATWILLGWKTIETRTHARFESLQGKRFGVHAAQTWDRTGLQAARAYLTKDQVQETAAGYKSWPRGAVICTAICHVHKLTREKDAAHALIECYTQRYGLFLRDVIAIDPPIVMRGHQGLWRAQLP
jgi:hypothetical protein